jgi:hypothetical protein
MDFLPVTLNASAFILICQMHQATVSAMTVEIAAGYTAGRNIYRIVQKKEPTRMQFSITPCATTTNIEPSSFFQ